MQEEFIYFLWQHRLFDLSDLRTSDGRELTILKTGFRNPDAGPDFNGGRIAIDSQEWFGNVEMHVKSSDWLAHGHQHDPAYLNVILHVVWEHDKEIYLRSPGDLPVLELSKYTSDNYLSKFRDLSENLRDIACRDKIRDLDEITLIQWKDRLMVDRLRVLSQRVEQQLEITQGDWQEVLYRHLARAFGLKVNALAFEVLAKSVPYAFISRFRKRGLAIEAIMFGQAGMLEAKFKETYPIALQKEYDFWKHAFGFTALAPGMFKYLRMHPTAFPDLRIAQFAALLKSVYPISDLVAPDRNLMELKVRLEAKPHEYWRKHFRLGVSSNRAHGTIGNQTLERIILHGVIPVMYTMGMRGHNQKLKERAIQLLESMEAEKNKVTRKWAECGIKANNGAESQALIHGFKEMCSNKKCLSCLVGRQLLMSDHYDTADI